MEINIYGKLYVYFIKSIFKDNKKIGIEFIINSNKSDFKVIDGLQRLDMIKNNRIEILNDNYPTNINLTNTNLTNTNLTNTNFLCEINLSIVNNKIIIKSLDVINIDKKEPFNKKINKSIYLNKYSFSKQRTINDIMNILNSKN
jgi:hypothetical protein